MKPHVEWHEQKVGVFYHQDQNAAGSLLEKISIGWQGNPVDLGERLNWEACRHGLGRARQTLAVGDGAPWIWPVASREKDTGGEGQRLTVLFRGLW